MDKMMREILVKDSRSENMTRRLLRVSMETRERRLRRLLLGTSGTLLREAKREEIPASR